MKLVVYSDPRKFWTDVSPLLLEQEAKNSLLLGLSKTFVTDPSLCVYQGACFDDDGVTFRGALVCSQYRGARNLLVTPIGGVDFGRRLIADFCAKVPDFQAIIGDVATARFYQTLAHEMGFLTKVNMEQGIYSCSKVIPPASREDIIFRAAESRDVAVLGPWIELFTQEAVPHDPPVNGIEFAEARVAQKSIYVLERDGDLMALAAWARDLGTSATVNLVYTPPNLRKQGFASLITAKLTQYLLDQGKRQVTLYADLSNPTSNKIYQKIGFEFVADSVHFGVWR